MKLTPAALAAALIVVFSPPAAARSDYDRHVVFDNSLTNDSFYYSAG